jgi:hypothetical protein
MAYRCTERALALLQVQVDRQDAYSFRVFFESAFECGEIVEVQRFLIGEKLPAWFRDEVSFAGWLDQNPDVCPDGEHSWYDYKSFESDGYGLALMTSKPCAVEHVDNLARYFFEGRFAGEYYGTESPDAVDGMGRLFFLNTDFTKSRHDDWTDYINELWPLLKEGSPVRKTNRMGIGTAGTRAVVGLGCDLWVAFR